MQGVWKGYQRQILVGLVAIAFAARVFAGGTPENAVIIIDPTDATSMYVGNYYKNMRDIPETNVLYMRSNANNYSTFTQTNQNAFLGSIQQRGIRDHIDYVVIAPFNGFYIPYSGEPTGPGSAVTCGVPQRYSMSATYLLSQVSADFVSQGTAYSLNQFFGDYGSASASALAFSSNQGYLAGVTSTAAGAKKYYIGALLGYVNGAQGNSVSEVLSMIDHSVGADGSGVGSTGAFYYMNNTADSQRNVRACGGALCRRGHFSLGEFSLLLRARHVHW